MIDVRGLTKSYGGRKAVDNVSFTAAAGRVTALLGPNGAGKTTTIRVLLGLERADCGVALVDGRAYRDLTAPLREVGVLFDGSGAAGFRTPRAHLAWLAASNGIDRRSIAKVLDEVGLASAASKRVSTFSLGMGQRLGIAAALLGDPKTVVLDEPMNGLDAEGIRWVRSLVRRLAGEGRTVLVTSHLLHEVQETADDLVVMTHGRIVRRGVTSELVAGHRDLEEAYFNWTAGKGEYVSRDSRDGGSLSGREAS